MLVEAIVGLMAALGIFFLLQSIKSYFYNIVPTGENIGIETVICVRGNAPELEQTVKGILHLYENAGLQAELMIKDCGMDAETALCAEKLWEQKGIKIIT